VNLFLASEQRPPRAGLSIPILSVTLVAACVVSGQRCRAESPAARLERTLAASCFECHAGEYAVSEPLLDRALSQEGGLTADPATLTQIRRALADESMPPADASRPLSPEDRRAAVQELDRQRDVLRRRLDGDPGVVVMPLLNRAEYENVIRDLTGLSFDASSYIGSQGGAGEGFANVGAAQSFSPGQFEKYLQAATDLLGHLRASPISGLTWHEARLREVATPAERRRELIDALMQWYVVQEAAQCDDHFERLADAHDVSVVNALYLEAAWRYRFRAQLGRPDDAVSSIAAAYDPPLREESLRRWIDVLTGEGYLPVKGQAGREAWQALPAPADFPADTRRDVFDEFGHWWGVPPNVDFEEDWPRPYEKYEKEPPKETIREGRWPFDVDVRGVSTVYLLSSDLFDRNEHDVVRWRRGVFHLADGREVPWDRVADSLPGRTGTEYPLSREADDSAAVTVQAPEVLRIQTPDGARRFTVTAMIDPERGSKSESLVQVAVMRSRPRPFHLRHLVGRRALSLSGNGGFGDAFRAGRALEFHVLERNRNHLRFEEAGIRTEAHVLGDLTADYDATYFDGPYPVSPSDPDPATRPYYYTAEMLRKYAAPDDLARLRRLQQELIAAAQMPVRKAQRVLERNGVPGDREGALPKRTDVSDWDDVSRTRWPEIRDAAETFRRRERRRAEEILRDFAELAWRGDLSPRQTERLADLFSAARQSGASFDEAVKAPLRATLVSPQFLFRPATSDQFERIDPLDDLELASRLSFGLWSSIPDEELLSVAKAGRLTDPEVLRQQARRMIRDEKVRALADQFAGVWFRFADFEQWERPDAERFPEFTPQLSSDMANEAELFFTDLFSHDRPVTDVLFAESTFLNERLAEHYGIDGVEGERMRRVRVGPRRGGLLGMGSVLTRTSAPLRTSPVIRGAWVLEEILGQPLPDPPPNVDPISEDESDEAGRSVAEQLAAHRASDACSGCHDRIDPLGLALERFDPIGRWRDRDAAGRPLATTADTVDGRRLTGFEDLRDYLRSKEDSFVDLFCRKFTGYLLGRPLHPGDDSLIERMKAALAERDFRFSAALDELVVSRQFLYRRPARSTSPATQESEN